MRKAAFGLALIGALAAEPCGAAVGDVGYVSGNSLYQWCSDANAGGSLGSCLGYLAGLSDAQTDRMPYGTAAFCVPYGVTLEQLREVVWDYLRAQAAYRQFSASVMATLALHAAYPCATAQPPKK